MRRWPQALIATFLAMTPTTSGCHKPKRAKLESVDSRVGLAAPWLHESPCLTGSIEHIVASAEDQAPPRTVRNPETEVIWNLSLNQAIAIAFENSEIIRTLAGGGVATTPSRAQGAVPTGTGIGTGVGGGATTGTDGFAGISPGGAGIGGAAGQGGFAGTGLVRPSQISIYDPAIEETQIQSALSVFDARWETRMFWSRTDQPPGVTFGGGIPIPNQRDQANFSSTLSKLLATGGVAGIAFNTDYVFIPPFGAVRTPAQYTPNVEFTLRQPLLRGAGVDYNRAPVVIARLQSDQTLWDFKEAVLGMVRSVEEAYWNLYAAHVALRSIEEVVPQAQEVFRVEETRVELQQTIPKDSAQARYRLTEFRQQRTQALNTVLEQEATLRNLLGLPPSDGYRLVPSDDPLRAPVTINWSATLAAALDQRPTVVRNRLQVRIRELELLRARNELQPDLNVEALWRINGLDNELDEAIGVLNDNQFTDWQLGLTFSVPLGLRQASAVVQASELRLDRERAQLREIVHETSHTLSQIVRSIDSLYEQYREAAERLDAATIWMEGARNIYLDPPAGKDLSTALNEYLEALRSWAAASTDASNLLAQYNANLARLEEQKGTLLASYNIFLQEDPIARVRRFRSAETVLRELQSREAGN